MKVLVINSPLFRQKNLLYDEDSLPPIGLGIIATALKKNGYSVDLIDAVALNMPLDALINAVNNIKPSVICINVFTTNLTLVKEFVETIDFEVHFIIGSLSTRSLQPQIFNWNTDNQIDVVNGDGELIVKDLVNGQIKQEPEVKTGNRRYFKIDSMSVYYNNNISDESLDRNFFVNEPTVHPLGFTEANIVTSRGCIYNCAFCAAASSLSRDFGTREKSAESVIAEITHLIQIYPGLESVRVLDDLFLKNPTTVDKAITIFRNFDLVWRSMAHVQTFKNVEPVTIRELKNSGCKELFIGIESGSPRILKQIHKTHDIAVIKQNIVKLLQNGINVKGYFIYGFPGETVDEFEMTYSLASYLKDISVQSGTSFRTSVFQYRPYHGTELHKHLEDMVGSTTINQISNVEPNVNLSKMVGRLQFNFHSGNYSDADINTVHNYIQKTTNLNSFSIFGANERPGASITENTKV